jgi:hypothetical protein
MAAIAFPVGGALIRAWTPDKIKSEIEAANGGIRAALRTSDMDLALTLISRNVGLRFARERSTCVPAAAAGSLIAIAVMTDEIRCDELNIV